VTGAEGIEGRFIHTGETAEAAIGADGGEAVTASSDNLVGISLVTDVPDKFVVGGVEDVVQGEGEFYGAKTGGEVAGMTGEGVYDVVAQLDTQLGKVVDGEPTKVVDGVDAVKYHPCRGVEWGAVALGIVHNWWVLVE
jgi:hypothetical protein